jgi:hypothetical protein
LVVLALLLAGCRRDAATSTAPAGGPPRSKAPASLARQSVSDDELAAFTRWQRDFYGKQGVIFTTNHPKEIRPVVYAKAVAALGKTPGESPRSRVVTGIMVVRPFTVSDPGTTMTAGQRVMTTRPKTDLLIAPF